MSKELTSKQKMVMAVNSSRTDSYYIKSKREKGQKRIFKCPTCKKDFDLSDSEEYGAAVAMFEARDGNCVGCYYKLTGDLVY